MFKRGIIFLFGFLFLFSISFLSFEFSRYLRHYDKKTDKNKQQMNIRFNMEVTLPIIKTILYHVGSALVLLCVCGVAAQETIRGKKANNVSLNIVFSLKMSCFF